MLRLFKNPLFWLSLYFLIVLSGVSLSIPIQVIPDETAQLLNVYAIIQNKSLILPYETYYTVWVHLSLLPFTIIYWGVEYLIQGLPDVTSFSKYVASNYMDVLPFLRGSSALMFIVSTVLVSNVVRYYWSNLAARFFICFVLLDLLLFINLHYSKHWIIDISWVFLSIFLYWRYLITQKITIFCFAIIAFSLGVFSSHPLVIAGLYPLLMMINAKLSIKLFLRDLIIFLIIFFIFFFATIYFGAGKIIGQLVTGGSSDQVGFHLSLIPTFIKSLFDYNPLLTSIFFFTTVFAILRRKIILLLLTIPFIGYLLLIASFHYEPRYGLFLVVSMSLVSAIFVSQLRSNKAKYVLVMSVVLLNIYYLISWHLIAIEKDTRTIASEWVLENIDEKSFVIYNTVGFNYIPLARKGIEFVDNNFPNTIGTREKLHLSMNLDDGINGLILRRIDESNHKGNDFIGALIQNGFKPILLNERYGYDAYFFQPSPTAYNQILNSCEFFVRKKILPYRLNEIPKDFERYGDILYNFTSVFYALRVFSRPGPIMTIYEFNEVQPDSCI